MSITGSVKEHSHINDYFSRDGEWQYEDTCLKFPDGTMIQTHTQVFSPLRKQPRQMNRNHIRWNGESHEYTYTENTTYNRTGYTHNCEYFFDWKHRFTNKPIIFT